MEPIEQTQPPSPELEEAVNTLRLSFNNFLQQSGVNKDVATSGGMKLLIRLDNRLGSRHQSVSGDPLLEFVREVYEKAVWVREVKIEDDLTITLKIGSENPSKLEQRTSSTLVGATKTLRENTIIIEPDQGIYTHADKSVAAAWRNTEIEDSFPDNPHGHAKFLATLLATNPATPIFIKSLPNPILSVFIKFIKKSYKDYE